MLLSRWLNNHDYWDIYRNNVQISKLGKKLPFGEITSDNQGRIFEEWGNLETPHYVLITPRTLSCFSQLLKSKKDEGFFFPHFFFSGWF